MSDYAMYVPVVNRFDLLDKAIDSAHDLWEELTIIDNSDGKLNTKNYACRVIKNFIPLTFAQSMNLMFKDAKRLGAKYMIFMHSDAEAREGSCAALLEWARNEKRNWGVLWTAYDALAAYNLAAVEDVGLFDNNLPWYFSDNDYFRRLRLAGYECIDTNIKVEHTPSQTLNSDPELLAVNHHVHPLWGMYYAKKWGGMPEHETFLTPFNR